MSQALGTEQGLLDLSCSAPGHFSALPAAAQPHFRPLVLGLPDPDGISKGSLFNGPFGRESPVLTPLTGRSPLGSTIWIHAPLLQPQTCSPFTSLHPS